MSCAPFSYAVWLDLWWSLDQLLDFIFFELVFRFWKGFYAYSILFVRRNAEKNVYLILMSYPYNDQQIHVCTLTICIFKFWLLFVWRCCNVPCALGFRTKPHIFNSISILSLFGYIALYFWWLVLIKYDSSGEVGTTRTFFIYVYMW